MLSIVLNLISGIAIGFIYSDLSEKGCPLGKRLLIWFGLLLLSQLVIFAIESVVAVLPSVFTDFTRILNQFS